MYNKEGKQVMEDVHDGVCQAHQSGLKLRDRFKRMGFYWPTIVHDCIDFTMRFDACQLHANFIPNLQTHFSQP